MRILIAALAVAASTAMADPIARSATGDWVRFSSAECPAVIADKLPEQARERFRKALGQVGGQSFTGCWAVYESLGGYLIQWEDGDQGLIPSASVHEEPVA